LLQLHARENGCVDRLEAVVLQWPSAFVVVALPMIRLELRAHAVGVDAGELVDLKVRSIRLVLQAGREGRGALP